MSDAPGSDGISRSEVYRLLDAANVRHHDLLSLMEGYQEQFMAGHERMRNALDRNTTAMTDGFAAIRVAMATHQTDDDVVERRVHDLEEREKVAATTLTKRNIIASGLVATVVGPAAAKAFAWWFGRP